MTGRIMRAAPARLIREEGALGAACLFLMMQAATPISRVAFFRRTVEAAEEVGSDSLGNGATAYQ